MVPGDVGVQCLGTPLGPVDRQSPGLTGGGTFLQELYGRRREVKPGRICSRVESTAKDQQVQSHRDHDQKLPERDTAFRRLNCSGPRGWEIDGTATDAQNDATGDEHEGKDQEIAPLVREQHLAAAERFLGLFHHQQKLVGQRDESLWRDQDDEQATQQGDPAPEGPPGDERHPGAVDVRAHGRPVRVNSIVVPQVL